MDGQNEDIALDGDQTQPTEEIMAALNQNGSIKPEPDTTDPPTSEFDALFSRLTENPQDTDDWKRLVDLANSSGEISKVQQAYDELLKHFPNTSTAQIAYISHYLNDESTFGEAEGLFIKFLRTSPNVDLWKFYLTYVRRRNTGPSTREIVRKSYEFALNHVGQDKDSGEIWNDYIQFLKSGDTSSTWEEQQKMDTLRKAYHRAVQIPLDNVERLWSELETFETGLNKITAEPLLTTFIRRRKRGVQTTKLNGPARPAGIATRIFGFSRTLFTAEDPATIVEEWTKAHGPIFSVPVAFGRRTVFLVDVKAASHFLARDTGVYQSTGFAKVFIENLFGRGILWAEEDDHRRQRKALTPAFSLSATRGYLNIFYDSAYKIKSNWDALLDAGEPTIEVQSWMNHASLDDLGIAGFGHDFGALDGKNPEVIQIFEAFERPENSGWLSRIFFVLGPVFPVLQRLPTKHNRMMRRIKTSMGAVADTLLNQGGERKGNGVDKSIMGLLVKAESAQEGGLTMSEEEVLAQMNTLLFAGYETTSISLTWALIELCRQPDKQEALRKELSRFEGADPSWDDLIGLPYLDGVVQETLRLHPPLPAVNRVASQDDVVPLSEPITTATGEIVSSIVIAKGTTVNCPFAYINRAEEHWGPDARDFKPERWIEDENGKDGLGAGAKTIQGYHHLLTFSDGPRLCIGRNFAIGNFKATLSVLIRNFRFELPDGVETKIGRHRGILARPRLESEEGPKVPLIVRRIEY